MSCTTIDLHTGLTKEVGALGLSPRGHQNNASIRSGLSIGYNQLVRALRNLDPLYSSQTAEHDGCGRVKRPAWRTFAWELPSGMCQSQPVVQVRSWVGYPQLSNLDCEDVQRMVSLWQCINLIELSRQRPCTTLWLWFKCGPGSNVTMLTRPEILNRILATICRTKSGNHCRES